MSTTELIEEIQRLPLSQRYIVIEETLKSIRKEDAKYQMSVAAEELAEYYVNDKELTAFTSLDLENFYEAR